MLTATYIKVLSFLETDKENHKIIRLWALNLSNELGQNFLNNINEYSVKFMQEMAIHNILDEVYIITVLNFIKENQNKNNFIFAFNILCASRTLEDVSLSEELLQLEEFQAETISKLYKMSSPDCFKVAYTAISITNDSNKVAAIYHIFSSRMPLPKEVYEYYLEKINNAKTVSELESVIAEYETYVSDSIRLNGEIYNMSTTDLIKALEKCPDLQAVELSKNYLELALLRNNRRQGKKE